MPKRAVFLSLVLCLGLLGGLVARADDVPDDARKFYDKAKSQAAAGDLKKAFSSISKARSKNPDSIDFWLLYVKIYRGLEKKETVLWDKIIAKVEAKHPTSPTFHLLRYRLAKETEERIGHLRKAIEAVPDAVDPKLLLARELLKIEEEEEAEEILDAVLEEHPGNEFALVTKGDLMIESGFSRSAVDYADEALAEHDLPGLHDLAARANLIVAENDEEAVAKAEEHAKKAVAGRPDPEFVLTYARILDLQGKTDAAVKALSENHAKTSSPKVAGKLGEMAFRTGDYAKAVEGLRPAAAEDLNAARALLECEARCGRAKEAKAALQHVLRLDPEEGWEWAVGMYLDLGDLNGALKATEGKTGDGAAWTRLYCLGRLGRVEPAQVIAAEKAKVGDRMGEEYLLPLATAHVVAKLGSKAKGVFKAWAEARWAAGRAKVEGAEPVIFENSTNAKSFDFMQRFVTYRRSLDGSFFEVAGMEQVFPVMIGEQAGIATVVVAQSECARDAQRIFPFNALFIATGGTFTVSNDTDAWEAANGGFVEGCEAFVAGDWGKAAAGFQKAHEAEAAWGRAKLFQAAALMLAETDLEQAATLAKEASELLPDDWSGRRLAALIRTQAGKDVSGELKALALTVESYANRYYDDF